MESCQVRAERSCKFVKRREKKRQAQNTVNPGCEWSSRVPAGYCTWIMCTCWLLHLDYLSLLVIAPGLCVPAGGENVFRSRAVYMYGQWVATEIGVAHYTAQSYHLQWKESNALATNKEHDSQLDWDKNKSSHVVDGRLLLIGRNESCSKNYSCEKIISTSRGKICFPLSLMLTSKSRATGAHRNSSAVKTYMWKVSSEPVWIIIQIFTECKSFPLFTIQAHL